MYSGKSFGGSGLDGWPLISYRGKWTSFFIFFISPSPLRFATVRYWMSISRPEKKAFSFSLFLWVLRFRIATPGVPFLPAKWTGSETVVEVGFLLREPKYYFPRTLCRSLLLGHFSCHRVPPSTLGIGLPPPRDRCSEKYS